tara:strand:- start:4098 stop:4511 length:414 start_codon:yes stop_codon:yes gene_type:complete
MSDSIKYFLQTEDTKDSLQKTHLINNVIFQGSNGKDIFYYKKEDIKIDRSDQRIGGFLIFLVGIMNLVMVNGKFNNYDDIELLSNLSSLFLALGGLDIYYNKTTSTLKSMVPLHSIPCGPVIEVLDDDGNKYEFECN